MRFELDDDQQAIQRTAKEFLASRYPAEEVRRLALEDKRGFTDEGWRAIAELGWPALVIGEDDGGLGLGVVELAVLQEQLGYALAPTPLLSTIAAALAISAAGDADQRAQWLPALAEGERRGTVAPLPPADGLEADAHALTTRLEAVPHAADADLLIVPTGHDDLAVVERGGDGVAGLVGRSLEHAQAERGHRDSVVENKFCDHAFDTCPNQVNSAHQILVISATVAPISRR